MREMHLSNPAIQTNATRGKSVQRWRNMAERFFGIALEMVALSMAEISADNRLRGQDTQGR